MLVNDTLSKPTIIINSTIHLFIRLTPFTLIIHFFFKVGLTLSTVYPFLFTVLFFFQEFHGKKLYVSIYFNLFGWPWNSMSPQIFLARWFLSCNSKRGRQTGKNRCHYKGYNQFTIYLWHSTITPLLYQISIELFSL